MTSRHNDFWIYLIECENGALYAGYTNNVARRFRQHLDGSAGVRYTRSFRPVRLARCWRLWGNVGAALKVERAVKKGGRALKRRLVEDPALLGEVVAQRVADKVRVEPFDPTVAERAARALTREELRARVDPLAPRSSS